MSVETTERPVGGADPACFCNALHLPYTELRDNGFGHCTCRCHTPGEHVIGNPCPCNSTRGKEQEWRNS